MESISDEIRDALTDLTTPQSLLGKRTLYNIKNEFQLFDGRLDKNDFISVSKMIALKEDSPDNPILFYRWAKNSDEANNKSTSSMIVVSSQFQLEMLVRFGQNSTICMDSTHGTSMYSFLLTSLVVVDKFHNGITVAHCISDYGSAAEWITFFNVLKVALKERLAIENFQAKTIMTDDDSSFYNAWATVFGPTENRFLCIWHLD